MPTILRIDPNDNLIVALRDLAKGDAVDIGGRRIELVEDVPAKHKFTSEPVPLGGIVTLYGVPVGKALAPLSAGERITVDNVVHYAAEVDVEDATPYAWEAPDVSRWADRTFDGVIREDGRVGTANYWLILPLVFCENRNVLKLRDALERALGYAEDGLTAFARSLVGALACPSPKRPFARLDGVRAIVHNGGCGGTAQDAWSLCRILAAYADHPNVAGLTVFSLGCEKAQIGLFQEALRERNLGFDKPCLLFRQQDWSSETKMMEEAVRKTLAHLEAADRIERRPVPLCRLRLGVKCGASDGFSGISANPVIGDVSDRVVTLGGASVLGEFPELCGMEGNIISRCLRKEDKGRFLELMRRYEAAANACGASISDNPSPGNIHDGLITDAIKSAGAAKKGGKAPISAVLDYGDPMPDAGLSLVCTPGNDVEAVTGLVASGANVILFSTGMGTPTGNPIVPVLKIATNTAVARRLDDLVDFDCGPVIDGEPIGTVGDRLLEKVIETAGGHYIPKADRLDQHDFLFWKREVSL